MADDSIVKAIVRIEMKIEHVGQDVAYVREWAKQSMTTKPDQADPVQSLRAEVRLLAAELNAIWAMVNRLRAAEVKREDAADQAMIDTVRDGKPAEKS